MTADNVTPTKILVYGLLIAGLALLVAGRAVEGLGGSWWIGVAVLLIALSCLADGLLPGGTELTDEQVVMLRQLRVPYRPGAERTVSAISGVLLLGLAFWLMFG